MKITKIEAIPLVRKLDHEFLGGTYRIINRNTIITRVYTDEGIIGEVFGGDEDTGQDRVIGVIRDHFAPLLIGKDPRDIEHLWSLMFAQKIDLGNRSLHTLDLYNHALFMQAISAVDMALWDTVGKIYNAPVYKLLGGYTDRVPVIAIGGYYEPGKSQDALNEEMLYYRELQLAGVKFKVGRETVATDVERVSKVREVVGDDFVITCDANQAWTTSEAVEFCRAAAPLNLRWIEEPVRWYDQLRAYVPCVNKHRFRSTLARARFRAGVAATSLCTGGSIS